MKFTFITHIVQAVVKPSLRLCQRLRAAAASETGRWLIAETLGLIAKVIHP